MKKYLTLFIPLAIILVLNEHTIYAEENAEVSATTNVTAETNIEAVTTPAKKRRADADARLNAHLQVQSYLKARREANQAEIKTVRGAAKDKVKDGREE